MSETQVRELTIDKFIDRNSSLRRTTKHILHEPNLESLDYIKPSYSILYKKTKNEMELDQFKKFMDMLRKIQFNIPLCKDLEQMSFYAKFMKEILLGKCKLKYNENIALAENQTTINQRKLLPKITDPYMFTIPCSIGSLNIGHTLCDLEANINLMLLSMM